MKLSDYRIVKIKSEQKKEIIDYGVLMSGAPLEWGETRGKGVRVGIIDTGADLKHVDLADAIMDAASFVPNVSTAYDDNGHGTHIAGIVGARINGTGVVGVAPECELYIAKAFDKNGNSSFPAIQKSVEWMIKRRVNIINMSFSSHTGSHDYEALLQKAHENGITLVCAAGNDGKRGRSTIGYPGKFEQTITVTAVDMNKQTTKFSSSGIESELCAAGVNIYSTYPRNTYASLSGTSMATPIISGAAALLDGKGIHRYRRHLTPDEIRFCLHMYTEDVSKKGWDKNYGYGLFSFGRFEKSDFLA